MKKNRVEIKQAEIFLDSENILNIICTPTKHHSLDDVQQITETTNRVRGTLKTPILVDIRQVSSLSRDARKHLASDESSRNTDAVALLVSSLASKIMANVFITFVEHKIPIRLFTSIDEAKLWLHEHSSHAVKGKNIGLRKTRLRLRDVLSSNSSEDSDLKNRIFSAMNILVGIVAGLAGIGLTYYRIDPIVSYPTLLYSLTTLALSIVYRGIQNIKLKSSIYIVIWICFATFMTAKSGGSLSPMIFAFVPLPLITLIFFPPIVSTLWMCLILAIYFYLYLISQPSAMPPEAFLVVISAATIANFCIAIIFNIFTFRSNSATRQATESAIAVLSEYSSKNFDSKMEISGNSVHYDAIASGVNMLGEELASTLNDLKKYQNDLEFLVEARTKELQKTQIDLINASKFATLGEIAGGIAHEINNPLAAIILRYGHIRHLIKIGKIDSALQIVDEAEGTARKIEAIITGLRSFSRSGEKDPFRKNNLMKIIDESLSLCRERFVHHGIEFSVSDIDPDLHVECNGVQIAQVVLNLLTNAKQAIENSKGHKWVQLVVKAEADLVKIEVTDCGSGIPENVRDKIMQPFFTTKEVGQGTGLGLSISKGIAERHQGRLFVDATRTNTCFVLELPNTQKSKKTNESA